MDPLLLSEESVDTKRSTSLLAVASPLATEPNTRTLSAPGRVASPRDRRLPWVRPALVVVRGR
jgi:hypothetical protein